MTRYTVRRLISIVPILLGVSIVVFVVVKLIPGNPVDTLLGPGSTPAARAQLIHQYGLDKPLVVQYFVWLGHVLQGNLGQSIAQQQAAGPLVLNAMENTMLLSAVAFLLAAIGGAALGALAAFGRGRASRAISAGLATFTLSAPQYSVALILVVYLGVKTGWFPTTGMYSATGGHSLGALAHHIALPAVTAALVPLGLMARMFRSNLLDAASQPWVSALQSRGFSERRILAHIVHNALPSVLTLAGLQFGYLLSGVVFVESIFSWPGIGFLVYQSISSRDITVIQSGVLVSACAFVLINLAVDLFRGYLDPRVRPA